MNVLKTALFNSYDPDDAMWGVNAMNRINTYFATLPPESDLDPKRLGSKSVFISTLKSRILADLEPMQVGQNPEFDNLTLSNEQLKFKLRSIKNDTNRWVHNLEVVPKNLKDLFLSDKDSKDYKKIRDTADKIKLRAAPIEFDGDALLNKMMPLLRGTKILHEVVPALLLATGRRSIEILKTAFISLDEGMDPHGYECVFSGQAKSGLDDTKPYVIPLLAPFDMVFSALAKVRRQYDATKKSSDEVHQETARPLDTQVKRLVGVTPHFLRTIYAMMAYKLCSKKSSLIGFILSVLGHSQIANATKYQRVIINNLSGPYVPLKEAAPDHDLKDDDWVCQTGPERNRVEVIKSMMLRRKKVTSSSVRSDSGGSMPLIKRVIEMNQAKIDAYNATL